MQIETHFKFHRQSDVSVETNYFEYPHVADIKIARGEEQLVLLLRLADCAENHFLNYRQSEMQKEAELHWKRRGFTVLYLKSKMEIDEFIDRRIR
jgi:hypothetical protein